MGRTEERNVCADTSSVDLEVSLMDARDPLNSLFSGGLMQVDLPLRERGGIPCK